MRGLFVAEGSSDHPLAGLAELLFRDRGVDLRLTMPPFEQLRGVPKDVEARVKAGLRLMENRVDLVMVHRDADNSGSLARREEIAGALRKTAAPAWCPIIPVRMTEAWLLLDESLIRQVAGNPRGKAALGLPKIHEVEKVADPKEVLRSALLAAAESTGRRRERDGKRFNQQRRQLLERLDRHGPVSKLSSWRQLLTDVDAFAT
ncbi:hypothetical protein P3102_37670 [Amycolatopsis sp. QT-25]|uniref:hypothetical protein n=1 Tax=Amycolatopsis sp. QT-25 TaxID=3034022 RepID=UPI0023ED0877|nr:hypothetical protein [Amycolatopsis sp. QT-25]WET79672.1 hypothetical protein P3102_37670 [Amycolatopsis sp. QT-25]